MRTREININDLSDKNEIITHFGANPDKGGIPAIENRRIDKRRFSWRDEEEGIKEEVENIEKFEKSHIVEIEIKM